MEIASLISMFLGPLIGVLVAWQLSRDERSKLAAVDLLRKTFYDLELFHVAYLDAFDHVFKRLHVHEYHNESEKNQGMPITILRERVAALHADAFLVETMFADKGDQLVDAITEVFEWADDFVYQVDELPAECFSDIETEFFESLSQAKREIRLLRTFVKYENIFEISGVS